MSHDLGLPCLSLLASSTSWTGVPEISSHFFCYLSDDLLIDMLIYDIHCRGSCSYILTLESARQVTSEIDRVVFNSRDSCFRRKCTPIFFRFTRRE